MKWQKKSDYCLESDCGHYRISKSYIRGKASYTPWIRTGSVDKDGNWWGKRSLDVCETAEEAKNLINGVANE